MNVQEQKIGIMGIARSGLAAAYKIKELGGAPFLSEFKAADKTEGSENIIKEFDCEFGEHTERLLGCDTIIVSPGISLNVPILEKAKEKNIHLISEIEFGFLVKYPESKIIAITGSNGKSTTVNLIHHILQTAGYNSVLAGNIGMAFCSYPIEKAGIDFIVLELSSFQLELIDKFKPDVAAILNITPDHLNRYNSFDDYALAKFNIFRNQDNSDFAILNLDDEMSRKHRNELNSKYFSLNSKTDIYYNGKQIKLGSELINIDNSTIKGPHNVANIMASILAVSPFGIDKNTIEKSLSTFASLPHRLEFVAEVRGVKFINDSKATNTESVKYALQSFNQPIRIIMGGGGKGEDYSVLIPYLKKYARKVYLTGEIRLEMKKAFTGLIELAVFEDFEQAIRNAFKEASAGEYVVLSPACTSYDMFNNFEERGNRFKEIVLKLKNES
jgi:UDP-N-acetylmuramoylalanine--D-glutamate ligase